MISYKFFITSLKINFNTALKVKSDFLVNLVIALFKQMFFLLTWFYFLGTNYNIKSWDFKDIAFIYGLVSIGIGLVEIFLGGVKNITKIVENRTLDIFLLKPLNLVLSISISNSQLSSISDILTGIIAIIYSNYAAIYPLEVFLLIPLSILSIFSLNLYFGSLIFFVDNSSDFIKQLQQSANMLCTQPNSGYSGIVKLISFTIMPVGYLSYFPVEFIKNQNFLYLVISYIGTLIFFIISYKIFFIGIKKYEFSN